MDGGVEWAHFRALAKQPGSVELAEPLKCNN